MKTLNSLTRPYKALLAVITLITTIIAPTHQVVALERLGLHFTKEELDIWKQRARNGPYKQRGDVSPNSPNDWERILSNANAFLKNPKADRWNGGYQGNGCVPKGTTSQIMSYEPHKSLLKIRDAAFVYQITGDTGYRDAVKNELLGYYVGHAKMDFSNRSRWCLGQGSVNDMNPGFIISGGMDRALSSYDLIRDSLTQGERERIEKWLRNAGDYFRRVVDDDLNPIFKDRQNGIIKDPASMGKHRAYTHDGGYSITTIARRFNNRRAEMMKFVSAVGILVSDRTMKDSARQFFIDWMKFGVFPDGTHNEYYRNIPSKPEKGFGYTMSTISSMICIADVFARSGDSSLYDYVTSDGFKDSKGGKKNLLLVMQNISKYINHDLKRYFPGKAGQINYLIDGRTSSWKSVFDIYFSKANVYYKDEYIKNTYLRKQPGVDQYPSNPAPAGAFNTWQGIGGMSPGVLFMYGQMEGKVWPYPSFTESIPVPMPPMNLKLIVQ